MDGFPWLLVAAAGSAAAALLHIGCIAFGAAWYRYFGAGQRVVRLAHAGHWWPPLMTAGITALLVAWTLYALAAAGWHSPLPASRLVLPAIALGVSPMALLARTTRAAVLEIMTADFVRTARSKGMSETRVVTWHVMRNALVIILTAIGLQFGVVMGQAVVVEKLFSWPGIGSLLVDSVLQRDIPTVQGTILVVVLFFLAVNTLVDLLYGVIDPRIRYA